MNTTEDTNATRRGSECNDLLGPLPDASAFAAGLDCDMRGFLDVMAWSENEFTTPLYTAEQLRAAVAAGRERMRALIADDASAMTYQTMGQYRSALLKALKA